MSSSYRTVEHPGQDEFIEQRSRFIGYVCPVQSEQEALDFISEKKKQHWDATHNVYAYVLRNGGVQRFSDDGEPHGTAGVPVLEVLLKSGVTDVVVVVTRYFGGILLGAGGLVRAYTKGAGIALEAGNIITMQRCSCCRLECAYPLYGKLSGLIPSMGGVIEQADFGSVVELSFHLPTGSLPEFEKQLADLSCGSVTVEIEGEQYYALNGS